ncbi:MAG TPA: hypothetical protein VFJ64_03160 [Solirubrobacterales bacterium]|nr:hypothetical protein [Solirubrobacterales bacterium]
MNLLAPADASTVYRDLHRAPGMVAAFGPAFISLDPSRDPPNRRYARALEDFVAYKAAFGLVRGESDAKRLFDDFARWRDGVHCENPSDPRVLPLHVFDLGGNEFDLACEEGSRRFLRMFGKPRQLRDGSGRIWCTGPAHGREEFCVAGLTLSAGTHWDVSADGKSWRIANASEVWKVDGRAYVNAAPNEHLRGPQAKCHGQARLVWRADTKNASRRKKERH